MSDYISREAALEAFENADADVMEDYGDGTSDWGFGRKNIRETLNSVPAADVEPVGMDGGKNIHTLITAAWTSTANRDGLTGLFTIATTPNAEEKPL